MWSAKRVEAVGRSGDIEIEREVLADGQNITQMTLERVAGVKSLRAVAGPQHLDRLPRLVDGKSRVRTETQLCLDVRDLVALRARLERKGGLAQKMTCRVDQAARPPHLDLYGLEVRHPGAGVRAGALGHGRSEQLVGALGRAESRWRQWMTGRRHDRDTVEWT